MKTIRDTSKRPSCKRCGKEDARNYFRRGEEKQYLCEECSDDYDKAFDHFAIMFLDSEPEKPRTS